MKRHRPSDVPPSMGRYHSGGYLLFIAAALLLAANLLARYGGSAERGPDEPRIAAAASR